MGFGLDWDLPAKLGQPFPAQLCIVASGPGTAVQIAWHKKIDFIFL